MSFPFLWLLAKSNQFLETRPMLENSVLLYWKTRGKSLCKYKRWKMREEWPKKKKKQPRERKSKVLCIINTAQTLYMPRKTSSSSSKIKIIKLKFQLLYFRGNKDYSSSSAKLTLCFKNNRHSAESLSSIINHIQDIMTNHLIYSEIRKHDPYSREKKKTNGD